jgi:lipoyl(octanoyl) transferase
MDTAEPSCFVITDLGRMAYVPALGLQRDTHQRVVDGSGPQTVMMVEHDPVITVSRRPNARRNVLADANRLAQCGIDVQPTDRGGDVTYHGPGQLVVYPVLRLGPLGLNVGRYMRLLECAVADTVAAFGVQPTCIKGATGVWADSGSSQTTGDSPFSDARVGDEQRRDEQRCDRSTGDPLPVGPRKLCALGVRVSRGVTMHGFALNVDPQMEHFETIVPCGLSDCGVASLKQILGDNTPTMPQVKDQIIVSLRRCLREVAATTVPVHQA